LLATAAYEPSPGRILKWHTSWHRITDLPKVKCPPGRLCAGEVVEQLWIKRNKGNKCVEAVVVFRGTVFTSFNDWIANLHWLHQATPIYDYYDQARDNIRKVVDIAEQEGCAGHIIAVGHSLGGALAQHVAYANPKIRRVYAFDPSFVIGTDDFFLLGIPMYNEDRYFDYVYEHGEILAFLRFISRHFQPYTACNPRIRTVRFNVLTGSITNQHSIWNLANKLRELSQSPGAPGPHKKFDLHAGCPVTRACRAEI
jgi:pimeloyl-ACP methyl ester carboxylesterase